MALKEINRARFNEDNKDGLVLFYDTIEQYYLVCPTSGFSSSTDPLLASVRHTTLHDATEDFYKRANDLDLLYDGRSRINIAVAIPSIRHEGSVRANVSVTIEQAFVIHGVRVMEGKNGLFVAMPSVKMPDGTFKETCHAVTADARRKINDAVMNAYEQVAQKLANVERAPTADYNETPTPDHENEYGDEPEIDP